MNTLPAIAAAHGISRYTLRDRARRLGLGQEYSGIERRRRTFTDAEAAQLLAPQPRGRRPNPRPSPKHAPNLAPEAHND